LALPPAATDGTVRVAVLVDGFQVSVDAVTSVRLEVSIIEITKSLMAGNEVGTLVRTTLTVPLVPDTDATPIEVGAERTVTVMVVVPAAYPVFVPLTVTVAVPGAIPVMRPELVTVALVVSLDVYVTAASKGTFVVTICPVCPTASHIRKDAVTVTSGWVTNSITRILLRWLSEATTV
jgi:hypothetical protein